MGYQSVIQWGDRNSLLIGYANETEKGLVLVMNVDDVSVFESLIYGEIWQIVLPIEGLEV